MPQSPPDTVEVLIAADDTVLLRTLREWFCDTRYRAVCVGDAETALTAVQDQCPPLVLIDETIARVDSVEFCRWLRSRDRPHRVYVILLTANELNQDLIESAEPGVDDFVCKPIAQGELFARLRSGTRLLELDRALTQLARTDALTGLNNRKAFFEQLRREWARADRQHFPLSCVMLDVDFFKSANDTQGHLAGDEVLRQVAARLLENSRTSDFVCRFGGDEFGVLLPETNEQGGAVWSERIRHELAAANLLDRGDAVRLTASFGVAQRSQASQTPEQLVDLADRSLLEAKRRGRNRVVCYHEMHTSEAELLPISESAAALKEIQVRELAMPLIESLDSKSSLIEAANFLSKYKTDVAVVSNDDQFLGIVSENDVASAMLRPNWRTIAIGDITMNCPITFDEDENALVVFAALCRASIQSGVVTRNSQPVGTIRRDHLLRWFTQRLAAK